MTHITEMFDTSTDLCFARNRRDATDLAAFQRVDDAALPNVRVADEPNRDLLLVRM
jgi:hypothetical protein